MAMLTWKRVEPNTGPAHYRGYSGGIRVFSIHWSMDRNKDYELHPHLPGFKTPSGDGSVEELKDVAERLFSEWLSRANLTRCDDG